MRRLIPTVLLGTATLIAMPLRAGMGAVPPIDVGIGGRRRGLLLLAVIRFLADEERVDRLVSVLGQTTRGENLQPTD
jgi:hypothetical protein